jgi:integrase
MPKAKLDAAFCLSAACEPGKKKTDYWDDGHSCVGMLLECRASGGKTFYLRFLDQSGRQRQHKIGGFNDISFDQARRTARRLRSEVVLGGNPAAAKEVRKAIPTYSQLSAQHLAHAKTHMKSYDSLETIMRLHLVPRWGKRRVDEITSREVGQWLAEKSNEGLMPATVEKFRVMFGRSFELGRRWGIAGCLNNPTRGIQRPKFDNKRERFLSPDEAGRLLAAASTSLNPQLRSIVALLLLTGARVSELLRAEWRYVDLERRAWLIPMSKTGKARHVPLSKAAIDIIDQLPRFEGCPWLIPNLETKLPFVSIKHSWQTARKEAGLTGLRCHDLRHSAASFMINAGVDLFAVGKVLGHADYKSTLRYSHAANETLLSAVEAGASKISDHC